MTALANDFAGLIGALHGTEIAPDRLPGDRMFREGDACRSQRPRRSPLRITPAAPLDGRRTGRSRPRRSPGRQFEGRQFEGRRFGGRRSRASAPAPGAPPCALGRPPRRAGRRPGSAPRSLSQLRAARRSPRMAARRGRSPRPHCAGALPAPLCRRDRTVDPGRHRPYARWRLSLRHLGGDGDRRGRRDAWRRDHLPGRPHRLRRRLAGARRALHPQARGRLPRQCAELSPGAAAGAALSVLAGLGIIFAPRVLLPLVGLAILALLPVAYKWLHHRRSSTGRAE